MGSISYRLMFIIICGLFCAALEENLDHSHVITVPGSVFGSAVPLCNVMRMLRICSNVTRSINGTNPDVIDVETYLMELATEENASIQLVVMSSQVVQVLREHMFLSSTVIARAIVELTQQFNWSRITILADISDPYFLHTAEELYRMANTSDGFNILQLSDSDSDIEEVVSQIEKLNLRIVVLSLRSSLASKVLCTAHDGQLAWPEYAWVVHSVELSQVSCAKNTTLDGVITVQLKDAYYSNPHHRCFTDTIHADRQSINVHYLDTCLVSESKQQAADFQQIGKQSIFTETGLHISVGNFPYPSDLPLQYASAIPGDIILFYIAIAACFIVCTVQLVLYFYFRNEPAIKATSVSLSVLIFIGCYLIVLYLVILNSSYLPSLYKQSKALRNCVCSLLAWLNALAFPLSLILSTLLVKLLRVYHLFRLRKRASKFLSSNLALAACVLLLTAPNAMVSLIWTTSDPYKGIISQVDINGFLHSSVRCVSDHTIRWLLIQFVYLVIFSLLLIIFAILTRKIKYRDFKDTKKVSALSFSLIFTGTSTLFYWYLFRSIGADEVLTRTVLQIGHYCIILECQGFIFAPKLFPIIKERLMRRYYRAIDAPVSKNTTTSTL